MTVRYRLENVVRSYRESATGQRVEALRAPELEVRAGEILAVVGSNGSGKSTLVETMAFLHRPESGRLLLDGVDVWATGRTLAARRRCPVLLQRAVLLRANVLENVMYGLRLRGVGPAEARGRAERALEQVRLSTRALRGHRELSGGERQRVALARLLALDADVMLLDEPTAHVDEANERLIEEVIRTAHAGTSTTIIVATNNLAQASRLASRAVTLVAGHLFEGLSLNHFNGKTVLQDGRVTVELDGGGVLEFPLSAVAPADRDWIANGPVFTAVAIDGSRIRLGTASQPRGRIQAARRSSERCDLSLDIGGSQVLHASLPFDDYVRLGFNVGMTVSLQFEEGAVRLWPLGPCVDAASATHGARRGLS